MCIYIYFFPQNEANSADIYFSRIEETEKSSRCIFFKDFTMEKWVMGKSLGRLQTLFGNFNLQFHKASSFFSYDYSFVIETFILERFLVLNFGYYST